MSDNSQDRKTRFDRLASRAESDPEFARRLDLALAWVTNPRRILPRPEKGPVPPSAVKKGTRRQPGVIDPFALAGQGRGAMVVALQQLTLEQLKDIVSEHGMDHRGLALKWRTPKRLISLIVTTVEASRQKGRAFRSPAGMEAVDSPDSHHQEGIDLTIELTEDDVLSGRWPDATDVVVLPGVGSDRRYGNAFAPTAAALHDELTEAGLRVAYVGGDPDQVILLKSADWWGPVLFVGVDYLQKQGVEILAALILRVIQRIREPKGTRAVVRLGRFRDATSQVEWLDYDGPADDLPAAIKAWSKPRK